MALANAGVRVGLTEQQIVDLIVHHRRSHGQQQRTRSEYYIRTIGKARQNCDIALAGRSLASARRARYDDRDPDPQHVAEDSSFERAKICAEISAVLGIRILRILKLTGKDPIYHLELESGRVEISSVNKLIDQRHFRTTIASACNHLLPKFKAKQWEQVAGMMLNALTTEETGDETDLVGSARIYIDNYLSETPFIRSLDEEPRSTLSKPTMFDGHVSLCSTDLQTFINKTFNENRLVREVTSMLAVIGAKTIRVRAGRLRNQTRWILPVEQFPSSEYASATQEVNNESSC
jgi:hypothetical protein